MIRRDSKGNYALYQCEMCGKSYSWKSSYHRHLREECGKQQRAKCKNCGRQYRWRDSLNKHLKYECGVEPKYTCSVCGRKFRHKQTRRGTTIASTTTPRSPVTNAGNVTHGPTH
ncbi:zinc finger protein 676 [Apis mellifera]|uniref:Zinc finger protein 676 n=1 Tax=Apis mellifera TaxID=7460 RepID=A0A7M7IJ64_APIME|nr:zinc finger protein 676 [Apis mellifera]|eukprot:XP_016769365.2 zinc finger protein 676 [Apis mellifera]